MATRFRSVIERAEAFMRLAHAGQKLPDGRPYATRPAAVRDILVAELGVADEEVLVAALLHKVAEGTRVPLTEIGERFGPAVEERVRRLSKIPEPDEPFDDPRVRYITQLRAADVPTRQILLADRLHGLRELHAATREMRVEYLTETELLLADVLATTPGADLLHAEHENSVKRYGSKLD